jgi:Ca2+-binding EF-hand superfamily protein
MNSHETEAKIKLREKQLKIARLKSSINYQAIPYRTSSTNTNTNTNTDTNMNGMRNILKEVPTPIKERVVSLTTEPKHQLTTAINKALKFDVKKKNGKRRNGYSKNGKSRSRDGRYNGDRIEALAPPPPSKKITIRNLWKRRHAHSIDEGIRRERALEFETTGQQLSEILDGSTEEGKPKKKPRRYAARTIAGLISALTEEATGLEVAVDARNDTPLWKKQVDSLEINFSRLGVRALRMGGLDEALMDMSEDLSPDEKESMADSLQEEAKHAYDNFDLVGAPAANSTIDEIFDRIDTDNSGTLDEEELTRALGMASGLSSPSIKAQSSSALSKLVSRLINLYDTNGDGVVDREEYRKLVEDMAEVRKTQKQKQKERQEKKQEERERPGTFHPLKLLQTANRTFQRLSKKNKEESDTRVSNTGYDRLSSQRHSQASEPMTTAAEGNGVNFEGAQDISDDPSFMNTISKGEGSILFSDLKLDLRRLLFGAVPIVKRVS